MCPDCSFIPRVEREKLTCRLVDWLVVVHCSLVCSFVTRFARKSWKVAVNVILLTFFKVNG